MVSTMRDKEVFLLAPRDRSRQPEPRSSAQGFILVVEDDIPTLRLERVLLEEEGYSVEVVGSGEEALEIVIAKTPSLVLLDIGLPGVDGFTTCQRIREISRVPLIMVTGRDCLDDKVRGMNAGADDYVTKPFLTQELATRVKVLLRRSNFESQKTHYIENEDQEPYRMTKGLSQNLPQSPGETSPDPTPVPQEEPVLIPEVIVAEHLSTPAGPGPTPGLSIPMTTLEPLEETNYEGTVRLIVTTAGPVRNLIGFISQLRQNPQFRLLRLVANQHKEGMDIWLGLREPSTLKSILEKTPGVSRVTIPVGNHVEGTDPILEVVLN